MTRERLKKLRALLKESEHLEEEIKTLPFTSGGYVGDSVNNYSTGFPKPFLIQGYSTQKYDRLKETLQKKLREIQKEIAELEDWLEHIEDAELRDILRLQYVNGLTQEQIADELGYARETISRKLKDFWIRKQRNK